jgi:chromosome segregation ATPase
MMSVAGAGLFSAAGFLYARAKGTVGATGTSDSANELSSKLAAREEDLKNTRSQIARLEQKIAEAGKKPAGGSDESQYKSKIQSLEQQVQQLNSEIERAKKTGGGETAAKAELERTQSEVKKLKKDLETARGDADFANKLKKELESVTEKEKTVRVELDKIRQTATEPKVGGDAEKALRSELENARAEARQLKQESDAASERDKAARVEHERIKSDLTRLAAEHKRLEEKSSEMQKSLTERSDRLRELESARSEAVDTAVTKEEELVVAHKRELAMADQQTSAIRAELDQSKQELAQIRLQMKEVDDLSKRVTTLTEENRKLKAQEFASRSEGAVVQQQRPTGVLEILKNVAANGEELQGAVERVMQTGRFNSAAISDDVGFVIAGSGEHSEALAAFAALFVEVGARASQFFPMHALGRVVLEDSHGVTLSAHTVGKSGSNLLLVTLGVGSDGSDKGMGMDVSEKTVMTQLPAQR